MIFRTGRLFLLFVTSRVCGRGNVLVVSVCVCVCLYVQTIAFEVVDIEHRKFIFGAVVHLDNI